MKLFLRPLLFILVTAFILSSCCLGLGLNDACDDDNDPPTKTELITRSWIIDSFVWNGLDIVDDFTEPCTIDDVLVFQTDGKINIKAGRKKCALLDPDEEVRGTWSFEKKETQLKITIDGKLQTYTIDELDGSILKLSFPHSRNLNGKIIEGTAVVTYY
jgi:hypothetical protein